MPLRLSAGGILCSSFVPLQAHLVRANPAFVRGIAGNAFSCLCIASQNLGEQSGGEQLHFALRHTETLSAAALLTPCVGFGAPVRV
jgi:hypothetical protein